MLSELANIREHWVRYRDVTLQHLDMLAEEQLAWRPQPDLFSCGQHLVHILLRQLRKVPPIFAMVLSDRPDIRIRSEWGGI